jgi:hypothetical protein
MRPTRTVVAPFAAVLAAATLATPAIARPIDSMYQQSDPATRNCQTISASLAKDANASDLTVIKVPQSAPSPDGVDWADAAIGAAAATGLLAISFAGATTRRRRQRTVVTG